MQNPGELAAMMEEAMMVASTEVQGPELVEEELAPCVYEVHPEALLVVLISLLVALMSLAPLEALISLLVALIMVAPMVVLEILLAPLVALIFMPT